MTAAFVMFSMAHIMAIGVLGLAILILFISRKRGAVSQKYERFFALSLLAMEILYHTWMLATGRWTLDNSLPLELCSISLLVTIVLLCTGNKYLIDFVFFAGIGGAIQAMATPVLDLGFPHFRYFHFFYTHIGIILTALYFMWMKGYQPTFKGVIKTMVVLNLLLPFIFAVNMLFQGNYMFLRDKPYNGSLLDLLGPYPWYILSLEGVAFVMFTGLWLGFRKWRNTSEG
ncbi:TIGR02206 family membrane protein [Sporosarcina sp. YIM B06819]|uniref:YwaF family protein n=1 Tax=Sporosarcina sp. YIM B06819 TaxID=3081769 RepID=UPI00298C5FD7|nr:TIGR02206 family membrane protein [Sporosarcina sp. YIM B06819]